MHMTVAARVHLLDISHKIHAVFAAIVEPADEGRYTGSFELDSAQQFGSVTSSRNFFSSHAFFLDSTSMPTFLVFTKSRSLLHMPVTGSSQRSLLLSRPAAEFFQRHS